MGEKVARVRMCINERAAGMEEQTQEAGTIATADADGDVTDAAGVTAEQFEKQVGKFAEVAAETPFIKK